MPRRAEKATTFEEFERWDAALHRAISEATHNQFLYSILEAVHTARQGPLWGAIKRRNFNEVRRRQYQEQHKAIVTALVDRDADAANAAMRHHLTEVRSTLLGS